MMDPTSLLLTALATGAATAAKDTASQAVKDAYAGLKTLIQKRFANKPKAELALTEYEQDEDTWKKPLQKSLAIANQLQEDPDLAAKTMALVKQLLHEGKLTPARLDES